MKLLLEYGIIGESNILRFTQIMLLAVFKLASFITVWKETMLAI